MNVGDLIEISGKYRENGTYAIVIGIDVCNISGAFGWTATDYIVLTNLNKIIRITESVASNIYPAESWDDGMDFK